MTPEKVVATPYDAEYAANRSKRGQWGEGYDKLLALRLASAMDGYRRAKAEDAALMEAGKAVLAYPARGEQSCLADISDAPCTCNGHTALANLRAAIAQYEGRTA